MPSSFVSFHHAFAAKAICDSLWRLVVYLICVLALNSPAAAEDLIGLYLSWSHDPTTTMTVNWVDIYPNSSTTVWHRKMDDTQWSTAEASQANVGPTTLQLRRVELKGLEPGTLY